MDRLLNRHMKLEVSLTQSPTQKVEISTRWCNMLLMSVGGKLECENILKQISTETLMEESTSHICNMLSIPFLHTRFVQSDTRVVQSERPCVSGRCD